MIERTREIIYKPVFKGAPLSWVTKYFRNRFMSFRKEHLEFDTFLKELVVYLKQDNIEAYQNIILLIEDKGEPNWISPKDSLFDVLIRIYNLCLSSKQAYEYIKNCYSLYLAMLDSDYKLDNYIEHSIRRSRWDGKNRNFVEVSISPVNRDNFHFNITTSDFITDDYIMFMPDVYIEVKGDTDLYLDTLSLFENYQSCQLYNKLFKTVISSLTNLGVFTLDKTYEKVGLTCYEYQTKKD